MLTPGQKLIASYHGGEIGDWPDLAKAIDAAIEAEREACAELASTLPTMKASLPVGPNGEHKTEHVTVHGIVIAAAIRARGNAPPDPSRFEGLKQVVSQREGG